MDNVAVVAGLVFGHRIFFFEHDNLQAWIFPDQLERRSKANSATADNNDIVWHGYKFCPKLGINLISKKGRVRL
jgi:hypothetical protein